LCDKPRSGVSTERRQARPAAATRRRLLRRPNRRSAAPPFRPAAWWPAQGGGVRMAAVAQAARALGRVQQPAAQVAACRAGAFLGLGAGFT